MMMSGPIYSCGQDTIRKAEAALNIHAAFRFSLEKWCCDKDPHRLQHRFSLDEQIRRLIWC